ncbi:uncharacterized protein LOC120941396 [Rana temporaria]|uniref:uncharacterized protein LOC120941396 n=1 Tax=Rana temporaria TaxID=8407 RepID=UPI001AADF6CA|nr:uncharacterized protein LOC120941396 [Rana temporaria]
MGEANMQVPRTFRDTLTFSEEEWMGLATWQKELYQTVIRDTAELFQSLGFMYQVEKEEMEMGDGWECQKSDEESPLTRESAIIEEISGENFIIQIMEMERTATPFPSQTSPNVDTLFYNERGSVIIPEHSAMNTICKATETFKVSENPKDGFFSLDTKTFTTPEGPGGGLVSLDTKTFTTPESPGGGLVSLDTKTFTTPQSPGGGLVSLDTKTFTTPESPGGGLVSLDTKTFTTPESPGDCLVSLDTKTFTTPESPGGGLVSLYTKTFTTPESPGGGLVSLDTKTFTTPESPGGGLVSLYTKTFTTPESPGGGLVSMDTKTFTTLESPGGGLVSLDTKTFTTPESPGGGLVNLDTKTFTTPESPGGGLVSLDIETSTTPENTIGGLVSLDNKTFITLESLFSLNTQTTTTLKNPGDGLVDQNTFIPSLSGFHVVNNENFMKTDTTNRNEETCGPVSGLCHPTDVFTIRGEVQTPTSTLFSESDFLTLIRVENINVVSKEELSTIQTQLWDVHSGCSDLLEADNQQSEAVFPVALMIPHNTIIPQHSWIGDQQTLIVDTPQWSRQVADCQQVDGEGNWSAAQTRQEDPGAPLVEKSFQCSFCKKSFLYNQHLKNHEKIHREDKSLKQPTCETPGSSKQSLLGNQEAHPISSQTDHVVSTDGPLRSTKLFPCEECGRTFSYLFQFNRHQKIHARDKLLLRHVAPPPKKVYKLPQFLPATSGEEDTKLDSTGDSCLKLHQHLQLSAAFLQNLLTSTAGFQYD